MKAKRFLKLLTGLVFISGSLSAVEIRGTIATTLVINEDSHLVGDVTCTVAEAPCISMGSSDVRLYLNGFTITGQANPPTGCVTTTNFLAVDGISIIGRRNVAVLGPGLIQRFRRHGIFVGAGSARVTLRHLTSSHNCFSGLQVSGAMENNVEDNVLVRNAIASADFPCGGNCLTNTSFNVIRRNIVGGNGLAEPNNDFGIGLVGTSSFNEIEENVLAGNMNGILIQANTRSNVIKRNVIVGNPPIQVNATSGPFGGVDIQNLAPAGANWMDDNVCLTYTGPDPSPCSIVRRVSGSVGVNSFGRGGSDAGVSIR
jgi:parallel beta-helix repeat protein